MTMTAFSSSPRVGPQDLVAGVVELASPPEIYRRITELMDSPSSNAADLGAVIENDPGLTARVLKLVNSAYFGNGSEIATVSRAIAVLGMRELHGLVLATSMLQVFEGLPNDIVNMRSFWHGSMRCAIRSKLLAARHPQYDALESVFVVGLLHEVGHLVMYRKLPEISREAILRHEYTGVEIQEAERQVFGFDFAAVGGALMRAWKLPVVLQEAIEFQFQPELSAHFPLETALVHLAGRMAGLENAGELERQLPPEAAIWRRVGLTPRIAVEVLAEAEEQLSAVLRSFD